MIDDIFIMKIMGMNEVKFSKGINHLIFDGKKLSSLNIKKTGMRISNQKKGRISR